MRGCVLLGTANPLPKEGDRVYETNTEVVAILLYTQPDKGVCSMTQIGPKAQYQKSLQKLFFGSL